MTTLTCQEPLVLEHAQKFSKKFLTFYGGINEVGDKNEFCR